MIGDVADLPKLAGSMRALKILVGVMGVMLVGGTALLIAAIIDRARHRAPPVPVAAVPGHAFDHAAVALPPGARVLTTELAGDRILVRFANAAGGETLLLLDARTGARLGTIDLLTTTAGEAKP
jgi:hypothetical protein